MAKRKRGDKRRHGFFSFRSRKEAAAPRRQRSTRALGVQQLESRAMMDANDPDIYLQGNQLIGPAVFDGPAYMHTEEPGQIPFLLETYGISGDPRIISTTVRFTGEAVRGVDYEVFVKHGYGPQIPLIGDTIDVRITDGGTWIYIDPREDSSFEIKEKVKLTLESGDGYNIPFEDGWHTATDPDFYLTEAWGYITDIAPAFWGIVICDCGCGCGDPNEQIGQEDENTGSVMLKTTLQDGKRLRLSTVTDPRVVVRAFDTAPAVPTGKTLAAVNATLTLVDFSGQPITSVPTVTNYYSATGVEADKQYDFAFQADVASIASGIYNYKVDIQYVWSDSTQTAHQVTGKKLAINNESSFLGSGWTFDELDYVQNQWNGATLVRGDNQAFWYAGTFGSLYESNQSEPNASTLELIQVNNEYAYRLTGKDGSLQEFRVSPIDSNRYLIHSRKDQYGNETTYQYDAQGRITLITDPDGSLTAFNHLPADANGFRYVQIDQRAAATGDLRRTEFKIQDSNNRVQSITFPDPGDGSGVPSTAYTYLANGLVDETQRTVISPSGTSTSTTKYSYNFAQQVIKTEKGIGTSGYSYEEFTPVESRGLVDAATNSPTNRATLSLAATPGGSTREVFGGISRERSFTVDSFGLVTSETTEDGTTYYVRDQSGALVRTVEPDPDGAGPLTAPITDYVYSTDGKHDLESVLLPDRVSTRSWEYNTAHQVTSQTDEFGRLTVHSYDGQRLESTRTVVNGTLTTVGSLDVVTSYTYTDDLPVEQIKTMTDPLGRVTTYDYYNDALRPNVTGLLMKVTHPDSTFTLSDYYDDTRLLKSQTDELGRTTSFTYDDAGRLKTVTLPNPDPQSTDPGPTTTYAYDTLGKIVQITEPSPDPPGTENPRPGRYTKYQYLDGGKHVQITESPREYEEEAPEIISHQYLDDQRRVIREVDALGRETLYTYNQRGQIKTLTLPNPGGAVTLPTPVYTYAYDNLGRLTSLTNPAPGVYSQPTVNASFDDDPFVVSDMVPMTLVELSGQTPAFDDAQDDPGSLRYEIVGNTNAALFHTLYISPEQGHFLIAAYAQGVIGDAVVTIRATNSRGLSQTRTLTFSRSAANASERLVNTTTTGAQSAPVTQALAGGNYVVVWQGEGTGDADGVFFQLYRADDTAIGGETRVNVTTAGAQSQPAVAADDEGGFAIVWTEQPTSGNTRVMFRQYADDGSALTGELTVNTNGDATDAQPDVAYVTTDSGAYFIVVWQGSVSGAQRDGGGSYSDADGVFSRAYQQGTGGWSWSDIQIVNTTTAGAQRRPTVASTRSGFAVAWEVTGTGPSAGIFLQRFVTPTMQASGETRVGFEYAGGVGSSYAVMSDGGLVIAWEVSALGATGVAAQMFAADGTPVGQQFLVSGLAAKPAVTLTADGFAVGYLWSGADPGVYVARYNPDGSLASAAARISDLAQPTPTSVDLSGSEDGRLIMTWARAAGSDTNNAYVKMLAPLPVSFAGGPQRVQALYPDRAILASADQIMLVLSQPAASLDINQVQVARVTESGEEAVALQSATRISELQYIVTFQAAATVAGTYRVRVLADAVAGGLDQDQDGTAGETNDDRFSGAFTIVPGPSAQAGVTSYQYDALGRVTQETDPAGAVTTYAYGFEANGNRTTTETILDPDGAGPLGNLVTKSEYDDLDRLVKETLPGAGLPYREYFYDKAGNLVRQRDALGNYTDYRYDSRDRQIRRFDANAISGVASTDALDNLTLTSGQGPITISTYTATGQLATVTDPRGGLTTYEYDRLDRLKKLIQPSAILIGVSDAATEYAYDYAGNLVKVTQPNPRAPGDAGYNALDIPVTEYEYDRQNNRVKMIQPAPFPGGTRPEFDYTYDDAGQLKSQTDPLDRRTDYDYDGLGRLKQVLQPTIDLFEPGQRAETTFTYDTLGNLLRETDPLGNVTQHLYDSASRRVATIDAMGSVAAMSYDALGQTIATTDELGRVTRYEHDVWGNQTLVHQNDPLDLLPSATSPKTIYAYDAEGNLLSVTDPRQHVTDYAYDKLNRLTSVTQPAPQVGQARPVTEYDYNDAGDLLSQTDPEGRVTRHTYDYLGQKTSMMAPDMTVLGGVNGAVTNYQYDRLGRLVKEIAPDPLTLGGTNRPETKYGYDLLGRMASQTDPDPDGAGSQSSQTTQFSFDAAGQLQFVLGPAGSQYFAYDTMGRRYVESSGGEELTIRLYDLAGNLFIELDRLGQVRSWTFDGLNRMTEAIDSRDGLTGYEYDAAGNRTLLVDPVGNETGFQYDQLNRLARETDPLGHARSFQYDANGNLTTAVDRLGRKVELGYDALNRKTSETWKDAAGVQVGTPITWSYDKSGRMLSATSAAASYGYTYDPAGQLDTLTSNLAGLGQSVVVDQAHNYLGRRKQLKTTIGAAADLVNDYAYDNLSRLTQVTQAAQAGGATVAEKRVDFAYEADNQIDTISRYKALAGGAGNLVATSDHAYDALRRLTDINNSPAQSSDWHWDYDAENQVTEFETTTSSGTANIAYAYDANGQLIGAAGAQTRSYVWDLNGNRRNYQDVGGANNQLTETATDTYTYDAEGNRKSATDKSTQQHTIYEWDHRNRLTKATIKANSSPSALTLKVIDIAYDAGDRRVSKTVTPYNAQGVALTPATEYYVWDQDTRSGSDNVIFDFHDADGAGSNPAMLKTRYLLGDVVDQVLAQETVTGSEVLWLLQDNLGSVRETVKNDGTVNSRVDFDPFGNMISIIDPSNGGAATTLKTRLNFTGQEYDADLKLVWYSDGTGRGRWYDPATGTFINQDALGFAAGDANLYRYVGNGATYLVDPSGQDVAFWGGFFADLPRALCDTFSSGEAFDGYAGFINGSVDTVAWLLSGGRYDPELRKAAPFGHTGASEDGGRIADVTLASQYGIVVVYTGLCGAPVILLAPRADGMTTIVSRWGRPGLKNGDWVMNGPISRWNYTWSGKWDPFPWNQFAPYGSGRQFDVPRTTLNCPGGIIGGIKGGLGQGIYVGPDILLP